jgi:BlaI family penicillinase repressor
MKALWAESPQTAIRVTEALAPTTKWKSKTVLTLLNRLVDKGAVDYEKVGRAHHFYPLVEEKDCLRTEGRTFLTRFFGGSLKPMVAHFLETEPLSKSEIADLRRILDEKEKSRRKKR